MIRWLRKKIRKLLGGGAILCDSCKYDYGSACTNRDRPNATDCDQYVRK